MTISTTSESKYQKPLTIAIQAALEAGKLLREKFHQPDNQISLDREVELLIVERLTTAFPDYGICGEEGSRKDCISTDPKQHTWLIDPLDGTSHFFKGARGAAVSIALLASNIPVLGVVYAFCAPNDNGDLFAWAQGCGSLTRNGLPIQRIAWTDKLTPNTTVIVAPDANKNPLGIAHIVAPARFLTMPSIAYRLALVAVGEGEVTLSLNSPCAWDYAAGHALLRGVGGELLDSAGKPIVYHQGHSSCDGSCFGGSPKLASLLATKNWNAFYQQSPNSSTFKLISLVKGQTISDVGLLSRALGCLLGQLAGDALGSLVEFQNAETIRQNYPLGVHHLEDGGTWNTLAGQPTDDSELALMLARTLEQTGQFNPQAIAQAYAYWYRSGPFDIGSTTYQAFSAAARALDAQADVAEAARKAANSSSQSNGALMRISPLGIFGHALSDETLANYARADAALSHPHQFCQDASAVFVVAIKRALVTGSTSEQVYQYVKDWATKSQLHTDVLQVLTDAQTSPPKSYGQSMGWVKIALQNAFYQCLNAPNLKAGIVDTVAQGGDTDTNAAIAGALLGAIYGFESIPPEWINKIITCRSIEGLATVSSPRPQPFWPVDVFALAERLLVLGKIS